LTVALLLSLALPALCCGKSCMILLLRPKMVEVLRKEFADYNLTYSIGGQISFDVFPQVRLGLKLLAGTPGGQSTHDYESLLCEVTVQQSYGSTCKGA
jgi:hypothetical protein